MATPVTQWTEAAQQLEALAGVIRRDLVPILAFPQGAPHTISREWACYVDYLGALYTGEKAKRRFGAYLCEVLAKVDIAYSQRADILLDMFRDGTVHEFDPKVLINSAGQRLGWTVVNTPERQREIELEDGRIFSFSHLGIFRHLDRPDEFAIQVSTRCLVADLLDSIRIFQNPGGEQNRRMESWNRFATQQIRPTFSRFEIAG